LPDCIITSSYNYNYKDIQTNDGQQSTRREHHVTNGAFKVWNIKTGQCIKAVNLENKKFPRSFTILADGLILSEVVAPSRTHGPWEKNTEEFQLWDIEKDCCLQIFKKSSFPTGNFVNGSDNDHVLHCIGKNIYVWNIKRGELLQKLMGHTGKILETVMLPDGHLVTSSEDKSIKVWNTDTGECLQTIDQPARISGLAILADGSLVSSFNDGSMTIRKLHPVLRDLNQANKSIEANFPQCKVQ
jgi:WD40 repeat protein